MERAARAAARPRFAAAAQNDEYEQARTQHMQQRLYEIQLQSSQHLSLFFPCVLAALAVRFVFGHKTPLC